MLATNIFVSPRNSWVSIYDTYLSICPIFQIMRHLSLTKSNFIPCTKYYLVTFTVFSLYFKIQCNKVVHYYRLIQWCHLPGPTLSYGTWVKEWLFCIPTPIRNNYLKCYSNQTIFCTSTKIGLTEWKMYHDGYIIYKYMYP